MTERLCLRCEWQGASEDARCPRCGAALYEHPASRVAAPAPEPVVPEIEEERTEDAPGAEPKARPRRTTARFAAIAAAVALVGGLAWWNDATAPPPFPALRGTLAYVGFDGSGQTRVFAWDLAGRSFATGPQVQNATSLVPISGEPETLGALDPQKADTGAATLQLDLASLLWLGKRKSSPVRTWAGALVAWSTDGGAVAWIERLPARDPRCLRIQVRVARPVLTLATVTYAGTECAAVTALGVRGDGTVVLTLERSGGPVVVEVRDGRLVPVLRGVSLRSMAADGTMLVSPPASSTGDAFPPGLPERTLVATDGHAPVTIRRGADGLLVRDVLAWSPDGRAVAVDGVLGLVRGVWVVPIGPDGVPGEPVRAGPPIPTAREPLGAAFDAREVLYVFGPDRLFAWFDGRTRTLHPPPGAPRPAGPLAWLDG